MAAPRGDRWGKKAGGTGRNILRGCRYLIKVLVCGALGRMGKEVLKAAASDAELLPVAAVDVNGAGTDIGTLLGAAFSGLVVQDDLLKAINASAPDVMIDFTNAAAAMENVRIAIRRGVRAVIGTTGLSASNMEEIAALCEKHKIGAIVSPNFSLGAILMMKMAEQAAKYFSHVEIIELHHDQKIDAPSGTALKTAELIAEARRSLPPEITGAYEKIAGARGGNYNNIRIHSVRLPGLVAHQEVIFGGIGQTLVIRHDSISRESFMPGVLLACKRVVALNKLVVGLEKLL